MNPEHEAIIAKINKLLSLATSDNEAEAQLASEKAMELLTRYNIRRGELNRGKFARKNNGTFGRNDPAYTWVSRLLVNHFQVRVVRYFHRDEILDIEIAKIAFMGEEHNVEIAQHMGVYLMRVFHACWTEARRTHALAMKDQGSFFQGMWMALDERLEAMKVKVEAEEGNTLPMVVRDKDLDTFVRSLFPALTHARQRHNGNASAAALGSAAGMDIRLNRAVKSNVGNLGKQIT